MAWIESHQSLERHPKITTLCAAMSWDKDVAIGKLHRFWWWSLDYAVDGDLRKFTDSHVADAMGVDIAKSKQLVEALVGARWLDRQPYFRVHDWWQYAGRFLQVKWKHAPGQWQKVRELYAPQGEPFNAPFKEPCTNQPDLPNQTSPPNPQRPGGDKSDLQKRIASWFKRKESTAWTEKELKALHSVERCGASQDEILLLEAYYTAEILEPDYRRRDILTLLNNWTGEIDRARRFKDKPASYKPADLKTRIATLEEAISRHPANPDSVYHKENATEGQKLNLKTLRDKVVDLKASLGGMMQ